MRSPLRALGKAIAARPTAKAGPSEPPVPAGNARWSGAAFGALSGYGGDADAQIAMYKNNTPLYSAAGFNALATAGITWRLFQSHDGRGRISGPDPRKEILNHQAVRVWNKPNDFMHGQFFREYFSLLLELTGLVYWVVVRNAVGIPIAIWPIKRNCIVPIPDPKKFLLGYLYIGPMNERIPLGLDEVIPLQLVDPSDPLGGVAPAEPLMTDLESARYTSEFRRNYFKNSANPGGVIQIENDTNLTDDEFDELSERWAEQHRGVRNAHRVAIIERGKWIQNDQSLKDLMLVELRQDDRNTVYEAYRTSKALMGVAEDVNRANAEAAEYVFSKWNLVPKLARIRDALNFSFMPMFSSAANGQYYWDFDNPVPTDWQADAATTAANAHAAAELVAAGYDPVAVAEAMSLPNIPYVGPPQQIQTPSDPIEARRRPSAAATAEALKAIPAAERLAALVSSWGSF